MTQEQANYIIQQLKNKGIIFNDGLTKAEISVIEQKFTIRFPPDLQLFLETALPTSQRFVNWRAALTSNEETSAINSSLNWPFEGMQFDLENNHFWHDEWGVKPIALKEQIEIAKKHYNSYPKLIPIYGHRFIPSAPCESGNPVFSVYQMDIIYYGFDLADYFSNEFHFELPSFFEVPAEPLRKIRFWSEVVE
ncbi:MAG: hypothetical protein QM725_18080 [Lacibacter sp.]